MSNVTHNNLINAVGNAYDAAILLAKRTRDLKNGSNSLLEYTEFDTHRIVATREIEQGIITMQYFYEQNNSDLLEDEMF
jgi:DNA-directed RNA polymerase omega subunit